MRRHATTSLEALDPDVLAAARDVARRAGVPVESWIASVLPSKAEAKAAPRRRRPPAAPAEAQDAAPATLPAAAPAAPEAPNLDTVLDALIERLDTIDRAIAEERETAQEAASRRIESLEARISEVLDSRTAPVRQVDDRLGEIERRMVELGEQFAASRPPGRRGRAAVEEVRDAVEEIRRRRREIEGEPPVAAAPVEDPVAAMRRDLARRLDAAVEAKPSSSAAIAELRQEIGRLRDSVGSLATGKDVGALERAMLTLAGDVKRAQQPADLAAVAAPIEAIRVQVERLAGDVSDNVYERVAGEFERVSQRIDAALAAGPNGGVDADAVGALFRELEDIRHVTAALAGPERIQGLVQAVHALSGQIEGLRSGFAAPDSGVAQLRPLLEEIRSGLDALHGAASKTDPAESRAIIGRIDALSDKVDRAESRRAPHGGGELASIQSMLGSLAEKVDTVGRRAGAGGGLDALEKQVLAIAGRLDARGADPALAGLERTMADLMSQVSALRDEAATVAAVERAARTAVADTIGETPELGLLKVGLADLQARQAASDDRMHATLEGVRGAIDRLVLKISDPLPAAAGPSLDDRLMSSTGVQPPRGRPGQRPEAPRLPAVAEAGRMTDELLEPGAGRPQRGRLLAPSQEPEAGDGTGDIKTNFIAAARRAAQAAHAEVAAEAADAAARSEKPRPARRGLVADLPEPAAPQRSLGLRATIEKRRKPLLLGLAAVVLVLGALQALTMMPDPAPASRPTVAEARSPVPAEPAARITPADPQTTQSIAEPAQQKAAPIPAPAPARSALPQVSGMQALAGDLAGLPAGLAALKQAALDGDGASVYELAVREADGRGMPRDLALAARLYEKLASAGYAPAQYRLGGQYEKGSGVVRDLAQAKLWYARAAEQGHARSMHNLAVIYAENPGSGGKPDFASAASWFRQAAEYGVRDSQYNLAVLYARGLGLGQDLVQSYAWFSAAATQGDTEAAKKRDDVAGKLGPDDLAKARTITANHKPRKADPAVNEPPASKDLPPAASKDLPPGHKDAPPAAMSLLGAPAPGAAMQGFVPPAKR